MDAVKTVATLDGAEAEPLTAEDMIEGSSLAGFWISTDRDTQGIARLVIQCDRQGLAVRAFGASVPAECDWGEVRADLFAETPTSRSGQGFSAFFDLGFKETLLQAKVTKGVLVVASFNRFKDDSGRANFFAREFFYRGPERPCSAST